MIERFQFGKRKTDIEKQQNNHPEVGHGYVVFCGTTRGLEVKNDVNGQPEVGPDGKPVMKAVLTTSQILDEVAGLPRHSTNGNGK